MIPATTSVWPLMNFVMLCTTMSAPSCNGFCRYGDANVLSTASRAPARWAMSAVRAMSVSFSVGFAGVSTNTSFVFGRRARATLSGWDESTKVVLTPNRVYSVSSTVLEGPYMQSVATTWASAPRRVMYTVLMAAIPDEAPSAPHPCSSRAMLSSSAAVVGFPSRVYLQPGSPPNLAAPSSASVNANVEDW